MDEEARRRHGRRLKLGPDDDTGGGVEADDLISALPDDLLHEVLVRLRCARAAARTSLVSRRWRGLWTRLPDLVFRNATLARILPALASIQPWVGVGVGVGVGVSLLNICVPTHRGLDDAGIPSLLHAAAGLSPLDFTLSLPRILDYVDVELPPFRRATSIKLSVENLRITLPPPWRRGGGPIAFPKLEELYLKLPGCYVDLTALVLGCPSLRVLWVVNVSISHGIDIRSESLQDLYVHIADSRSTDYINVEAAVLKTLRMLFYIKANDLSVSIVAPVLEMVSWKCSAYSSRWMVAGFGPWVLSELSLHAAAQSLTGVREDTCLQLPNANNVLSLKMTVHGLFDAEFNCVEHIERHLVTDFSILELIMEYDYDMGSTGHVYGPFVLHLLGSHRIRNATRRLQIFSHRSRVKNYCPVGCLCDEPKNWRSKNISLINLEEVVIDGFEWEDHEFDFLKVIFRCAPMLKRMVVGTVYKVTTSDDWCTKLYDIFKAYPSVECKLIPH